MPTLYDVSEKIYRLEQQGMHIIKFNVGDPDQCTDHRIKYACGKAVEEDKTKYSLAAGEMTLRKKLAEEHGVKPENVFIAPGSKFAVFAAMRALLRSGDKDNIILPSPHWNAFELIAKELGTNVKIVKTSMENNWQIDPAGIEQAIDWRTKLIILCNPNNPTSMVTNTKVLEPIIEVAREKHIPIISDECYADIAFKNVKSIIDYGLENVCIKSFSKTFAMTGWRIGYAIAEKDLIERFTKLAQITTTNVPVFVQEAAVTALDLKEETASKMREIYRKRAEMAKMILSETKLKFCEPEAPFYLFPYCGVDSESLNNNLIDKGVAIAPGITFGDYREYFRLALTVPDNDIKTGLDIIAKEFANIKRE